MACRFRALTWPSRSFARRRASVVDCPAASNPSWPQVGQAFPETRAAAPAIEGSVPMRVVDVRAVVVVVVDMVCAT